MKLLEYYIVRFFYESLRFLPFRASSFMVNIFTFFFRHVFRYRKKIIYNNLDEIYEWFVSGDRGLEAFDKNGCTVQGGVG